jgi:hypothetical protein
MNGHSAVELEHVTRAYRRDEFEVHALDDGDVVVVAPTPELRVGQTVTVAAAPVR